MDAFDPAALQVVGRWLMLALLFVLREVASGALKEAGKELWAGTRQRREAGPGNSPRRRVRRDSPPSIHGGGHPCPGRAARRGTELSSRKA
jgi:hypothetical protein